ncbi:hypothetical protein CP533_3980 [Ophiocordyceps camponoti-saundersi (nom. inval.)]|nr:hypothetical protein CP533_3980 [Ophiocordyceps camponoti-saundersi (nom. inval.)]
MTSENHALVFGATGLLGWGVLSQLLSGYPHKGTFSSVTAVLRRRMTVEELGLASASQPVTLVDDIDLLAGDVEEKLGGVAGVEGTTHVFYFVFAPLDGEEHREVQVNADMMRRVVEALNLVAPRMRSFVYGGGTKQYGIYTPGGTWSAPLHESLAEDEQSKLVQSCVYPLQRQILSEACKDRSWSWTELCPDAVIGFSPVGSAYSLALHWAQYLSLYGRKNGRGHRVVFPGCVRGYDSSFTPVSTRTLGRVAIYVGLLHLGVDGGGVNGKVINVADREEPITFRQLWPEIAAWFRLVGVGPESSPSETQMKPGEYVHLHRALFADGGRPRAVGCGVGAGRRQLDEVGWWLTFDRYMSLERLRGVGFREEREPVDGWVEAFERMREAGIIF